MDQTQYRPLYLRQDRVDLLRDLERDIPFVPSASEVYREHGGLLFQPLVFRAGFAANTLYFIYSA